MPLYELFSISKAASNSPSARSQVKSVIMRAANNLFDEDAVIRDIHFMGTKPLPYRMKCRGEYQYEGAHWLMHFYSGPQAIKRIKRALSDDADMIRCTLIKRGEKLKEYAIN